MLSAPEIYLYRESVDFRKSINGLAAMIESDTQLPLGSGALFLFTNKQRDKVKVLYLDKTGFTIISHKYIEINDFTMTSSIIKPCPPIVNGIILV